MITKDLIRTDLPPIINYPDGSVNCILALANDSYYDKTNTYFARWQTMNSIWYINNKERFFGWIELEHVPVPKFE